MRRLTFLSLLLAGALVAGPARAQQSGEQVADRLFTEAIALVGAGKYAEACPKFEESQRLDPALGTQFNLADCYEHTGKKGSARRIFIEVADAAKAAGKGEREKTSRERAAALEAIAPRLTVTVPPAAVANRIELVVDGVPFAAAKWNRAQPIDAGMHTVAASAPGKKSFDTKVALQDGKSVEVTIPELENEPAPPQPVAAAPDDKAADAGGGQRRTALVVGGVGVVSLLVGGGAGLFSVVKHGQAKDICASYSACPDLDGRTKWNTATDAGTVSTIGFIAGGFFVAAGAVLYFTASKGSAPTSTTGGWWVTPSVGLGSAGLVAGGHL